MNIIHKVTRKMLRGNKTRTLVTVIGILLSVAMFTAVTTMIASLQDCLIRFEAARRGLWEGAVRCRSEAQFEEYAAGGNVKDYTRIRQLALAEDPNPSGEDYVSIVGLEENFDSFLPLVLLEGRMPQNAGEIVLSERILDEKGFSYKPGDSVTFTLGTRTLNGEPLANQEARVEGETFQPASPRTYTVVGICERPVFEDELFPGYTAITVSEGEFHGVSDYFFTVRSIKALERDKNSGEVVLHQDLLRFQGRNPNDPSMRVLYGMAAILIGIISLGAISLIYNAFSISVSQRTRQFGILKSIGATNRQIRGSVFYEALLLSAIGIPLGVGLGVAGIGITLRLLRDKIALFFSGETIVGMRMKVSPEALILAAAIGLVTVLISAWIPATRAMRGNAIDAIRQTADVKIKAKKVRTPAWIYRLFKFEGMLADKNFKRNRRQYRATVLSLLLSIFLFISTSSFCSYLSQSVDLVVESSTPDIFFMVKEESPEKTVSLFRKLGNLGSVEECNYFCSCEGVITLPEEALTGGFKKILEETGVTRGAIQLRLALMEDSAFEAWLRRNNVSLPEGQAVMLKTFRYYNPETDRYEVPDILKKPGAEASVFLAPQTTSYGDLVNWESGEEAEIITYRDPETGEETVFSSEDPAHRRTLTVGAVVGDTPLGLDSRVITLVLPVSGWKDTLEMNGSDGYFSVRTSSPRAAEEQIRALLDEEYAQTIFFQNIAESNDSQMALITVVNVFSYGFIILISLIALTNVFNTINTNVILRRREFAMLRSVGLTRRGTDRMMIYECLLYGFKSLLYGLPLSIAATALIWRAISGGVSMRFYLPGSSIAIAVGSVFLVVFATMLYSMRKIRKENPIDALKSEIL